MRGFERGVVGLVVIAVGAALAGCEGPRSLRMVERSGDHAMRYGDYETAAMEYGEVVERRPENWRARVAYGEALLELDRAAEAREQLEVAATIRPEDIDILELLAEAMLESGDADAMATTLRRRAEDTNTVGDWLRLGIFLRRSGDLDGAERALLTAARIDRGENVEPQLALASVYREAGDDDRAVDRLRMAHYVAPEDPRVVEAIRSYGEIPGPTFARVPTEAR